MSKPTTSPPAPRLQVVRGAAPSASGVDDDPVGLLVERPHGELDGLFLAGMGIVAVTHQRQHPHSFERVHRKHATPPPAQRRVCRRPEATVQGTAGRARGPAAPVAVRPSGFSPRPARQPGLAGVVDVLGGDQPALQRPQQRQAAADQQRHRGQEVHPHRRLIGQLQPGGEGDHREADDRDDEEGRAVGRVGEAVIQAADLAARRQGQEAAEQMAPAAARASAPGCRPAKGFSVG